MLNVYLKYTSKVDFKYTSVDILKKYVYEGKYTLNVYFKYLSVDILKIADVDIFERKYASSIL